MPPGEGVPGDLRAHRGHDLQDERLGVPEGVALVPGAGEPLARDPPTLGSRGVLQQLEQGEPDGLLQLGVAVDLDVCALPEAVEDRALAREQAVEALVAGDGEGAGELVAQRGQLTVARPRVGHELGERDRLARFQLRAHGEPGVVGRGLAVPVDLSGAVDVVVGGGADQQPGAQGAVHEGEPAAVGVVLLRLERVLEQVVCAGVAGQVRLLGVGDEPGLQHDLGGPLQRTHGVAQGEHAALVQRHQPGGADLDGTPARRAPAQLARERARAEVQHALVVQEAARADVERMALDQQSHRGAVDRVHQRLGRLRVAVPGLGVDHRAQLVHARQVRARHTDRLALVEGSADAETAVRDGEDGLGARQVVELQPGLAQAPGFDGEGHARVFPGGPGTKPIRPYCPGPIRRPARSLSWSR